MYVVTREDLTPGYQVVQSNHAVADFIFQFPQEARVWHDTSNSIITLSVETESDLYAVSRTLAVQNIPHTIFREPDIGDAITAIALCPGPEAKEFCRGYKTALRPDRRVKKKHGTATNSKWHETWDRGTIKTHEEIEQLDRHERRLRQVVRDMQACEQTKGQSVLEHGQAVHRRLQVLLRGLGGRDDGPLGDFRLPKGLYDKRNILIERIFDDFILEKYTIFHDCGKPYCLTTDEEGRRHFLNHANVSHLTYENKCGGDEQVAKLIAMDMDIHTLKAKDVPEFAARPEAATLLLVSIAEIHANADMFGGIESDSFKIKWKQIDRRCRAILKAWEETDEVYDNGSQEGKEEGGSASA